jgi:hypothetical protein
MFNQTQKQIIDGIIISDGYIAREKFIIAEKFETKYYRIY